MRFKLRKSLCGDCAADFSAFSPRKSRMHGAMPVTSTIALTNATLPYIIEIANKGLKQAILDNTAIRNGVNIMHSKITYKNVAEAFQMPYTSMEDVIKEL